MSEQSEEMTTQAELAFYVRDDKVILKPRVEIVAGATANRSIEQADAMVKCVGIRKFSETEASDR